MRRGRRRVARRHTHAALIRGELEQTELAYRDRVILAVEELEALACELEDDELALDPACAVACMRLVSDVSESPLLNPDLPPELLRSRFVRSDPALRPDRPARRPKQKGSADDCRDS